jgi:hypothetical protein
MADLEYFPVQLPGGRAYPNEITIRQFGKDEVAFYDRLRRNANEANVRSLIGGTIQGEQVENLYEPDFLFMMMWHRVNSFINFPMKLPWTCPECETENSDDLDLSRIVSDELSEDYDAGGNTLEFPCGIPLTLRLPKMGDEARARRVISQLGIQPITEDTLRNAETVQLMEYDNNFNYHEKWDIVTKVFKVEDVFLIDAFKREFNYGPQTRQSANCKGCGGQQNVGFRFSLSELFPTNYDSGSVRARILHARPTGDAAKRARDAVLPKTPVAAKETPEKAGRPGKRAEANRGQHPSQQGQDEGLGKNEINAAERVKQADGPVAPPPPRGRMVEESHTDAQEPAPVVSNTMTGAQVLQGR